MEKEGQFLHIPEFGARFGLSRIEVFRKVKDGTIPHKREGKIYLIPLSFIDQLNGVLTADNRKDLDEFLSGKQPNARNLNINLDFANRLSIDEIEYIAKKLKIEICYNHYVLQNCLETPFLRGERREYFAEIFEKAAVLLYLLVKNRPFGENQQKLMITSLIWFLYKNGQTVKYEEKKFIQLCQWVQLGDSKFYKQMLDAIRIFLRG